MYTYNQIRNAILSAPQHQSFFPFREGREELTAELHKKPYLQPLLNEIRIEAEHAVSSEIPQISFSLFHLFESKGDRKQFENVYFDRRKRLLALAVHSLLDKDSIYMDNLENLIWEICNEYTWVLPSHITKSGDIDIDLFASETAHALAEILILHEQRLNPMIAKRIRLEIDKRILQPYLNGKLVFGWETLTNNWASVCAGSIGMTALLLVQDRKILGQMMNRVYRTMECFLEGYGQDGGCHEGITYWVYGFGYYVYFSEMLYAWTAGQLDLMKSEKTQKIAAFPLGVSLFDDYYVNYSDAPDYVHIHTGLASKLTDKTGKNIIPGSIVPSFHEDHAYRWAHVTRNLLWTNAACLNQSLSEGNYYFPDLEWVLSRNASENQSIVFSARGGSNNESHNHNDLGHFILHLGGESLLADLGAGLYTREYFGSGRYEIINNSSMGHSVPVIDGQLQMSGDTYLANVLDYEDRNNGVLFKLDLTKAYNIDTLELFTRTFDWNIEPEIRTAYLKLTDSFTMAKQAESIEEIFISLHRPELKGNCIFWQGKAGGIELAYNTQLFKPKMDTIDEINHEGEPREVYRIRLVCTEPPVSQGEYEFIFKCLLN